MYDLTPLYYQFIFPYSQNYVEPDEKTENKESSWEDVLADSAEEEEEHDPRRRGAHGKGKKVRLLFGWYLL